VILKALEKRPADRFPSVAAFAQALQQATKKSEDLPIPIQGRVIGLQQHQYDETVPAMPNPSPTAFSPARATSGFPSHQRFSTMKTPLLIGLVLLVLAASVGYFYVRGATSTTSSHASSTTTSTTG